MNRRERRAKDPNVNIRKDKYLNSKGDKIGSGSSNSKNSSGGGWGLGNPNSIPATGQRPTINPFAIPKSAGLTITSQTFPSNYFVEWNLATWRAACDQAVKMGYTMSYATLVDWVYECSPFVQSLFGDLESPIGSIPYLAVDSNENEYTDWTSELCNKTWHYDLRKLIGVDSYMNGFTGLNFDPIKGQVYKYPMQDIDPLNRMLRSSTFSFYDGVNFDDFSNLLFVQPFTANARFLGKMQAIARSFIQMNQNSNNWLNAGRRLAFPLMAVGYPQADSALDSDGNSFNPYKLQAENIAANIDPSQAVVFPYTIDEKGNIIKSIQVEYEQPGSSSNAHNIYRDFNEDEKNNIRQNILGGTLTSSAGQYGTKALGEVHGDKLEKVILDRISYITTVLNNDWLPKMRTFYKNMPHDLKLKPNLIKQLPIEQIEKLANVLQMSGKRLTDKFFVSNGLISDYFEDAPPSINDTEDYEDDESVFMAAIPRKNQKPVKKKFL